MTKYETYTQAVQVASELPGLPAGVLGPYSLEQNAATETVSDFHKEGAAMQKVYEEAGERYETLMTAPRSDLGDSIRKAFSNVDDILTDMSLEKTSENQRAVRILAYNSMEITPENIEKVKEADRQVSAVVDRLTPKNVLQMIRDGVNPLEKTFNELESYFSQNPQSYEKEAEHYSRFLYQLERKKDVTEEERKAYIGIYRMVHQIEREDGAAVGAVVNTGAELQFSTLLTAARSRRASHMDWKVSEDTGLTQEIHLSENNISEQIRMGMAKEALTEVSDDGESRAAYDREGLQQMREAGNTTPEAAELLQKEKFPSAHRIFWRPRHLWMIRRRCLAICADTEKSIGRKKKCCRQQAAKCLPGQKLPNCGNSWISRILQRIIGPCFRIRQKMWRP